jgi:ferredoxin-NADP reductase
VRAVSCTSTSKRLSISPERFSEAGTGVRSLRLVEKVKESEEITSFYFVSRDDGPLESFEAGQYLPIELEVPSQRGTVRRTYSLSNAPNCDRYRISVKRERMGVVSRHLHDTVEPGAILDTRAPAGDFVLGCTNCPVVLISAGVGLTPMLSMLHQLTEAGAGRPIWWIHGARDGAHHALSREVAELAARHPTVKTRVLYSRPRSNDELGRHYDELGRVTADLVGDFVDAPTPTSICAGPPVSWRMSRMASRRAESRPNASTPSPSGRRGSVG